MRHAEKSPSDAVRWMTCGFAIRADRDLREKGTYPVEHRRDLTELLGAIESDGFKSITAAEAGTLSHSYAEQVVSALFGLLEVDEQDPWLPAWDDHVPARWREYTNQYVEFLTSNIEHAIASQLEWGIEKAAVLWYEPESEGTTDFYTFNPRTGELRVVDYKSGYNYVKVEGNLQCVIYSTAICDEVEMFGGQVTEVSIEIFQPQSEPADDAHRTWRITRKELEAYRNTITKQHNLIESSAPLKPVASDRGCMYCVHTNCKARLENLELLFEYVYEPDAFLSDAEIEQIYLKKAAIEKWFKDARARILQNVAEFPGLVACANKASLEWVEDPTKQPGKTLRAVESITKRAKIAGTVLKTPRQIMTELGLVKAPQNEIDEVLKWTQDADQVLVLMKAGRRKSGILSQPEVDKLLGQTTQHDDDGE